MQLTPRISDQGPGQPSLCSHSRWGTQRLQEWANPVAVYVHSTTLLCLGAMLSADQDVHLQAEVATFPVGTLVREAGQPSLSHAPSTESQFTITFSYLKTDDIVVTCLS